jgi:branched-chain amino acid transport system ATP-binding protein
MTALLETRGLVKAFGGLRAVDGVDLVVEQGRIHAVIGPNGAGKTTLFNVITGHLRPTAGRVLFRGQDITGWPPHRVARAGLARTFQITNIFPRLTVLESVQVALAAAGGREKDLLSRSDRAFRAEALALLEDVGLLELADEPARTLSHGDQRALEVALALATAPKLLILDEPTAGMSPWETERTVDLIYQVARRRGLTVILCEHDMQVVFKISDWITVMHQGRVIAEGLPDQIRRNETVIQVYLGEQA